MKAQTMKKELKYDSLEEYFMDYLFPMALEFGMTSKEFWQDDPNLFSSYRTFYINKYKKQSEIDNNNAWLFGLYTNIALNTSLSNMWKKKW